jgi:hypothetical protein
MTWDKVAAAFISFGIMWFFTLRVRKRIDAAATGGGGGMPGMAMMGPAGGGSKGEVGMITELLTNIMGMAALGSFLLMLPFADDLGNWMSSTMGIGANVLPIIGIVVLLVMSISTKLKKANDNIMVKGVVMALTGFALVTSADWQEVLTALTSFSNTLVLILIRAVAVVLEVVEIAVTQMGGNFNVDTSTWNV